MRQGYRIAEQERRHLERGTEPLRNPLELLEQHGVRIGPLEDLGDDRIAGTLDIVVWAVRGGRLTMDGATSFLRSCDVGPSLLAALDAEDRKLADVV